jgi:Fe-S-cluster containining protein
MKMNEFAEVRKVYPLVDDISRRIVSCNGCTKCCESGIVYVLPEEKERLESLGVPLINIDGIDYIKRNNEVCSMLNRQNSKCSIGFYKDRPLCCRLFPLDVFNRGSKISWGIYNYCPPEKINPILLRDGKAELDLFIISIMAGRIEGVMPKRVLRFLANEDRVTAEIELLDEQRHNFELLDEIVRI